MTSILETLSLKELYTRKKNLIYQLEKIDEEIKKRILEDGTNLQIEITPYVNQPTKMIIKKINGNCYIESSKDNDIKASLDGNIKPSLDGNIKASLDGNIQKESTENKEIHIIRKIKIKLKK
jgi:hypothetical protein